MHILYVDESGHPDDPSQKHFVLGGVSVFERQTYWIDKKLNDIVARFNPEKPWDVELHGSPMHGGKGFWRKVSRDCRKQAIKDALGTLFDDKSTRIFAMGVDTVATNKDPIELAFLQLVSRFDQYLGRLAQEGDKQRGIILFDNSVHERTLQTLTTVYREKGHEWGQVKNLSEVPAFIDSRASRLIQLADLVAYAVGRKVNCDDDDYFNIIQSRFDNVGGKIHGLRFFPNMGAECD